MSKTKKILSVILCLIMVLSTVIVGFVTNATVVDGVKDYEDLTDEYEEFVYIATTFTNSKGEVQIDNLILVEVVDINAIKPIKFPINFWN